MIKDERLDVMLVKKNIFPSRERARESVLKGEIYVDKIKVTKCGKKISQEAILEFKGEPLKYVSRGGLKLEKALDSFSIDLNKKICADIGASTGGFTDCMIKYGAEKVFALDVGTSQLSSELLGNHKVISCENTNVKELVPGFFGENMDFCSIDVSFISLTKVLPYVLNIMKHSGEIVALIKPQFEAGRGNLNKQGVVKNKSVHSKIIEDVLDTCKALNLSVLNFDYSPIKGPNGNIEYLIHLSLSEKENTMTIEKISNRVDVAFQVL
ncbi:23S rRNA (cytidine1920-2'-O)/16S rRNA (cytidine1409-2'-O)-methyltransferase [Hathewaya proteolytica DSM 3090]|uniref:23S rRNA (Cytidine1920-2'-O)/16S rRNA (Cytidine1409-2'-O)-methyltransferase n=1 Tax=Hathewaya proteolytica DSM 3090 TaxID=1121331 RepID=A0A1M6L4D8_9CLOT|nr:TlyA family RNA methyltransferase [Hathewaya proteolytica]SHJ66023.1 23S rRNA (cytidine1920-2'-O)/16S rRNA (cytidine1409-2'-O)-methyltransferase [Hathewaya proteolytica DSM 3090]